MKVEKTQKNKPSEMFTIMSQRDLKVNLPERIGSPQVFSLWIRALLQNWRQGTVGCKGRSDVARSTKKPWKQKGTGRARAGTARSPLWRGGGVIFGPFPRVRKLKINEKVKKSILRDLASDFLKEKKVMSLDWLPSDTPKTSKVYALLKQQGWEDQKVTVFLPIDDKITQASFANIPKVKIVSFDQVDAFTLAHSDYWVFLKKDLDQFKEMVSSWI